MECMASAIERTRAAGNGLCSFAIVRAASVCEGRASVQPAGSQEEIQVD